MVRADEWVMRLLKEKNVFKIKGLVFVRLFDGYLMNPPFRCRIAKDVSVQNEA